jgi:uncharacterized protein YkwD
MTPRHAARPVTSPTLLAGLSLLASLALLSACGGGGSDASSGANGGGAAVSGTASDAATVVAAINCPGAGRLTVAQVLNAINQARSVARSCGGTAYPAAAPLVWSDVLATAAQAHSTDMATNNYFNHTGLNGSTVGTRVQSAGYSYSTVGENIAAGYDTLDAVMAGWLASPGHCANLMNAAYKEVALACAAHTGASYSSYWTQVLGASR